MTATLEDQRMTTDPLYDDEEPGAYEAFMAKQARLSAETHRKYLDWSQDDAQRTWAAALAAANDATAEAYETFAATIRSREGVAA